MRGDVLCLLRRDSGSEGTANSTLWYGEVNIVNDIFSGWNLIMGNTWSPPALAVVPTSNKIVMVVRGTEGKVYASIWSGSVPDPFYNPPGQLSVSWTELPGLLTSEGPAAVVIGNTLYVVALSMDRQTMWQCTMNLQTKTSSEWVWISGTSPSRPTFAQG